MKSNNLKIFGIGFHKTGTTSVEAALTHLGFKCLGYTPELFKHIQKLDYETVFKVVEDYDYLSDNPWPILYKELDKRFPSSKFILTIRDEKKWIKSCQRHFGDKYIDIHEWIYGQGCLKDHENIFLEKYRQHNQDVIEYFKDRKDDLLIIDVEKGDEWSKLCNFLNLDAPNEDFPHRNKARGKFRKSKQFIEKLQKINRDYLHIILKRSFKRVISPPKLQRIDSYPIPDNTNEIRLFTRIKNEEKRLPFLLDYYSKLGVDRFFIIDHNSSDNSLKYLSKKENVHIFHTKDNYQNEASWIDFLLRRYGVGYWCFLVDPDEKFIYPYSEILELRDFIRQMEKRNYDAIDAFMIDMYSKEPIEQCVYTSDIVDPLTKSSYFDGNLNNKDSYQKKGPWGQRAPRLHRDLCYSYVGPERYFGGVRKRVFKTNPPLGIFPLIKFNKSMYIARGRHFIEGANIADVRAGVLHFKFFDDFLYKVKDGILNEQHADNSLECKMMSTILNDNHNISLYNENSETYESTKQLMNKGFLRANSGLEAMAAVRKSV